MSLSLYRFVSVREPVAAEEVARDYLALPEANGEARPLVERLVSGDPRFAWEDDNLRTADPAALPLRETPYVVFDVETTGSSAKEGGITQYDMVGIPKPEDRDEDDPYYGVYKFKKGFGGDVVEFIGCLDLPVKPRLAAAWYRLEPLYYRAYYKLKNNIFY